MRFSIVVPVFDNAVDLGRCLESIGRLDYDRDRYEVIVVDNGSTDGSADVARAFGAICLEERDFQSSYAARNRGIRAARGEFVAFTDSDCVVDPNWLAAIDAATADAVAGCFAGEILSVTPETLIERFSDEIGLLRQRGPLSGWHFKPYAQTANAVYRRRVFDEIGLFDPTMKSGGDAVLAWRMLDRTAHTIVFVPDAVVYRSATTGMGGLWEQFGRFGSGQVSWATARPDYTPPAIAELERGVVAAVEKAVEALEHRGVDETELIHPVLDVAMRMAHLSGHLKCLLTTVAGGRRLEEITEYARGLGPRCDICGGTDFVAGPRGRLSGGRAPQCLECGSLERHRVLAAVLEASGDPRSSPLSLGVVGEGLPAALIERVGGSQFVIEGVSGRAADIVVVPSVQRDLGKGRLVDLLANVVGRLRDDGSLVVIGELGEPLPSGAAGRCDDVGPALTIEIAELLPNVHVVDRMVVDPATGARFWVVVASAERLLTAARRMEWSHTPAGDR